MSVTRFAWSSWITLSVAAAAYLGYVMFASADKQILLIGDATHGHHQIELSCSTCHGDGFGGEQVIQQACIDCHGEELALADDSHPASKFRDPRNADRLEKLDARLCVTCHVEHQLERTGDMGVTLPGDFCFACHQDIGQDRPTHQGMGFDTCASAGCHNYHDNTALYEDFLVKHANTDWLKPASHLPLRRGSGTALRANQSADSPEMSLAELMIFPTDLQVDAQVLADWQHSGHAAAGIGCIDCHQSQTDSWQARPDMAVCGGCHEPQWEGFTSGRHGMRLSKKLDQAAAPLGPMHTDMARKLMRDSTSHQQLTCNSCHDPHEQNLQVAAVDACLGCHADEHSLAYKGSPHEQLWQSELAGALPSGSGVSCASCHLPRMEIEGELTVQHNQNAILRPNEKMIRPVCMNCHGVAFSIDALADPNLINNNFNGQPEQHIRSIDMAVGRLEK